MSTLMQYVNQQLAQLEAEAQSSPLGERKFGAAGKFVQIRVGPGIRQFYTEAGKCDEDAAVEHMCRIARILHSRFRVDSKWQTCENCKGVGSHHFGPKRMVKCMVCRGKGAVTC